jgi:hypothetical protein
MQFGWRLVLVCGVLAAACGGGGGDAPPPRVVAASSPACPQVEAHDSGSVVYVLFDRACAVSGSLVVSLQAQVDGRAESHELRASALDTEVTLSAASGLRRVVSVHRKGTWRMFPNENSWGWRDGAGLLMLDDRLFLLGGYRGGEGNQNEVWASDNARDWTLLAEEAPWSGRHGAAWVVHDDRLWVISGDLEEDVWSSPDGSSWTRHAEQAPFGKRYTPNAVSDGQRIVLYGGQHWLPYDWCAFAPECEVEAPNDVWASEDGASWSLLTAAAPWQGRALIHGAAYFNGRIYLVGGGLKLGLPGLTWAETVSESSDVWSSADGVNWRLEATELGFEPRTHFSITASPIGCFVSDGSVGTQGNFSNDVFFADDCVHFKPIPDPVPMQKRHASSLAWFNGSLVILGGPPYAGPETTAGTAVWQYFP